MIPKSEDDEQWAYIKKNFSVFVLHFSFIAIDDAASNRLRLFTLLQSEFSNVSSTSLPKQLKTRNGCTYAFSPE